MGGKFWRLIEQDLNMCPLISNVSSLHFYQCSSRLHIRGFMGLGVGEYNKGLLALTYAGAKASSRL